jgi:flagellin FlaB
MFNLRKLHQNESGLSALETAIILIAFIVVASVFAFTILSAGSASTEKGQQAINAGLQQVQSSMTIKGDIIALGNAGSTAVDDVVFNLSLVSSGDPVDLTSAATDRVVVMSYRDGAQLANDLDFAVAWVGANDGDDLLEANELAEITVDLTALTTVLGPNTGFTVEIKPPTGAVLKIERTTPAAIEAVMDLN